MDDFVKLNPEERRIFFEGTATPRNIQAQIVEKDFWVCCTLKELFQLPVIGEHLIFKGGTSLSKVFKVIERFSEDIDVSIDRGFLGFGGTNEPEMGARAFCHAQAFFGCPSTRLGFESMPRSRIRGPDH